MRFDCLLSSGFFFFFSSRRRHTRFDCDWSSDVCSSDLREHRRLETLSGEIGRIDSGVRSVERIVAELERKRQLLAAVQNIEASAIRPLPLLRELTEILPGDAWLTMLSLDAKGVELTGQAAQASALIPLLENSPLLEPVEFASPVTRGRDREQFRIRAAWEARRPAA